LPSSPRLKLRQTHSNDNSFRESEEADLDEHVRAFGSVEFVRLSVERLEVLVTENGARLGTDVLRTAPPSIRAFASTYTQLYIDCCRCY